MRWTTFVAAAALLGTLGACVTDRGDEAPGGGGGPAYQADRRPDAFEARRHMAQALVDMARVNAALVREDWGDAAAALEAARGDLRLAGRRGTLDQQTRVIALEGRAIAVAAALDRRSPAALATAGQLVRDLVAYHDAYAWGPAQVGAERAGGGGGPAAPGVGFPQPAAPTASPLAPMMDPIIP